MHNIKMQAKNKCTLPVAEPETRDYAILALSHGLWSLPTLQMSWFYHVLLNNHNI